jgi:hypothetical protein
MTTKSRPKLLERDILKQVTDWLTLNGIAHYRQNVAAFYPDSNGKRRFIKPLPVGSPDIVCIRNGLFIGIEVKRPGKNPTPEQTTFADWLKNAGAEWVCIHSLEELQDFFYLGKLL